MTLGLKFLLSKNRNFSFPKKTPLRYVFSIAINVFLRDCIGKGACIKRMGAVRNYSTNTIIEKKQTVGEGGGVKDIEFSGVLKK